MEGILPLFKPKGMTSHDCVFKLRKILGTKKVGHTGTLDPDVTGVLPICVGRATKIAEYVTDAGKEYEGEVTLGFSTDTEDASGEMVEKAEVDRDISIAEIRDVLEELTGKITQTPPMFSAVKVNGKRLYEYARAGIEVERPSREISIYSLNLLGEDIVKKDGTLSFRFRVSCSKGTYIRTLAVTIGEKLGYPAHMSDLIRTRSSSFTLEDCLTFEQIEEKLAFNEPVLQPLEAGIAHLPKLLISDKVAEKIKNGAVIEQPAELQIEDGQPFIMMDSLGRALAIYQLHPSKKGLIKPVKVLRID
ncbi:tRNA pseudouridine(55) synthase TruB [Peribacillus sp. SCS-26]|uniref:tRNA pseudouridine(55) synthase TruB n=1 Tax=Paraperibacillus marinus TaxID=3115295 RepID=UPI0039063B3C